MPLTKEQETAVRTAGRPLFIQAGAGTGKTFTLTNRLAYGLSAQSGPLISGVEHLLTITFTNKAAGELLGRVRAELRRRGLVDEALRIDGAWISTIHSMCRRILLSHALEAGVDPGAEMLTEEESRELLGLALEDMLRTRADDPGLRLLVSAHGVGRACKLVADLALKLELSPDGATAFCLGPRRERPGTGMALVSELLAKFLQAKAEIEEEGLPETKTCVQNFAAIHANIEALRAFARGAGEAPGWAAISGALCALEPLSGRKVKEPFRGIFAELRDAQDEACARAAAEHARDEAQAALDLAQGVCERHRALKRARGAVDTNDLLIETYRLLEREPGIAGEYRERFESIMVDEFQDTDRLQVGIIERFCDEGLDTLATVGDAQQSIYGFRGADLEVYREMREAMMRHGAVSVKLAKNFRSHPDILGFVEDIFSSPEFFGGEFLKVEPGPANRRELGWAGPDDVRVSVFLSAGEKDPQGGRSATKLAALRAQDARSVADEFERLHAGGAPYGDMAILMQSVKASKSGPYVRELRGRGIPCVVSGGSDYYTLPEVKTLSMLLRVLADRDDDEALFEVLGSHVFDLSDDDLLVLATVAKQEIGIDVDDARRKASLFDALAYQARRIPEGADDELLAAYRVLAGALRRVRSVPFSQVVAEVLEESGASALFARQGARGRAVQANVQRFCDLLDDFEAARGHCIGRAAAHMREMCELAEDGAGARGKPGTMVADGNEAVQIMTIHSSKGLEFPIVAVAEYDKSTGGASFAAQALTECGATYLSVGDFPDTKTKEWLSREENDPGSFAAASGQAGFASHALALGAARAAQEQQRLFYVALTRARDALILVAHDSRYASTGKLSQGLAKDALGAVFPEGLPAGESVTRTASGAKVRVQLTRVPCDAEPVPSEDGAGAGAGAPVIAHPVVAERERARVRAWVERGTATDAETIRSYSSLARQAEQENPARPAGDSGTREAGSESAPGPELAAVPGEPETASAVGSAFHLVAQLRAQTQGGGAQGFERFERKAARRYELDEHDRARLHEACARWFSSARYAQTLSWPERHAEYAFCVDVDGMPFEGFIDLLCLDRGKEAALVIDYKTGTSGWGAELRERYALQAASYAYAVLAGGLAREVELVFVRPEAALEEVAFRYRSDDLPALAALLGASRA